MTGLGLAGRARPKTRPGDYERALEIMAATGADKDTKAYLIELRDATATHDAAREKAEAATAEAKQREAAALEVEETTRSDLAELAGLRAAHDTRVRRDREEHAAEHTRLDEWAQKLDAEQSDTNRREDALKIAFRAYEGATT